MYVILFIAFLVLMYFVTNKKKDFFNKISGLGDGGKSNMFGNAGSSHGNGGHTSTDPTADFARELGFTYTPIQKNVEKKELWAMGGRMKGEYKGRKVEMIMETRGVEAGLAQINTSHSYTMDNRIVMIVENSGDKKFEILPKSEHVTSTPTGHSQFDEKFSATGDRSLISDELRSFCIKLGWMHMKLSGNHLTVIDDYFQQPEFKSMSGSLKMMSAIHPLWGTSPKQTKIELSRVTELLSQMAKIVESI